MVDIASAMAGLTYLRDFMTYVGGLRKDADVLGRVNEAARHVGEVEDKLHELRRDNLRLLEENSSLKAAIAEMDDWKSRRAAYELVMAPGGAQVLSCKTPTPHYACPGCAERDKELHPLQDMQSYAGLYKCPSCKEQYHIEQPPGPGPRGQITPRW